MSRERHYVTANFTFDAGPSGAWRRTLAILAEMPAVLEPGESVSLLTGAAAHVPDLPDAIRVHRTAIPAEPTWRRALAERRRLGAVLDELGADLVDLATLPIPAGLRCPAVCTVHDLRDLEGPDRRRSAWLTRFVLRRSARRAAAMIVPSRFTESALRNATGRLRAPIHVIGGGVDARFLAVRPARAADRGYFLHVGHLEPRKNLRMLLEAYGGFLATASEPRAQWPRLVLAGRDKGIRAELQERAAELELSAHVEFRGVVGERELLDLYAGAWAVLVPSRHEGFGLPALEALAIGVPVAVAQAGALPEVVGGHALVLPPDDVAAWTAGLASLIQAGSAAELVASRKQFAATSLWSASARQTLAVWRGACLPLCHR